MLGTQDFETYTQIGHSLWADQRRSRSVMLETLSAVSLLDLTDERMLEKATAGLLQRASQGKLAASPETLAGVVANPFYRLQPLERLVLTALHQGRWSYARLSRVLDETPERIEEIAWLARVNLATSAKSSGILPKISYPAGARPAGLSCPEYIAARPWTQRFLDEEIPGSAQRLFFQNHLMACDSCRAALARCRDLYYAIETLIPARSHGRVAGTAQVAATQAEDLGWIEHLRKVCDKNNKVRHPVEFTMAESFRIFFRRREAQLLLCVLFVLAALKISSVLGS